MYVLWPIPLKNIYNYVCSLAYSAKEYIYI